MAGSIERKPSVPGTRQDKSERAEERESREEKRDRPTRGWWGERGSIAGAEGRDDEIRSRQEDIYFNKFRYRVREKIVSNKQTE